MIKASDYCAKIFDGTHDTPKPTLDGEYLVTSKCLLDGKIDFSSAYKISKEDYDEVNKRSQVSQYDILFSMIGTIGNTYLEESPNINYAIKNIGVFSCRNREKAIFLYYYLQSPYAKKYIERGLDGAVQKFLSLEKMRNFPVPEFSESAYKAISELRRIDDKISTNNKIIETSEKLMREIYDYWFVQFDFPDENGRPYKSSGGEMIYDENLNREIPKEWTVEKLGDTCKCLLGGTPSRNKPEYWGGSINWINSGAVNEYRISSPSETITEEGLKHTSTYLMPRNTTVLAITGATLGQVSILNIEACANQSVIGVVETDNMPTEYIYPSVMLSLRKLLSNQTGAAQPHINKQDVSNMLLVVPPKSIMSRYYSIAHPVYDTILDLCMENKKLEELRDWLLPMLMNGQIKVGD